MLTHGAGYAWVNGSLRAIATLPFVCPNCPWTGTGDQAMCRPGDVIRCPCCCVPLEAEESANH